MSLATHGLPFTKLSNKVPADALQELLIYYGYPISYKGINDTSNVINDIGGRYKYWIVGDSYSSPAHPEYASTTTIVAGVRAMGTKVYGYVPIGQSTQGLSIAVIKSRIDEWVVVGVDGIFLDEFGFDYGNTRAKQKEIVDYVHSKGLPVCANTWTAGDFLYDNVNELPWAGGDWRYVNFTTYNSGNVALTRLSTDSILMENFCFDHTGPLNVYDVQERALLTMTLANSKNVKVWAEAVFGETTPGTADLSKLGSFDNLTDAGAYVAANAYLFDIKVVGTGGYSFGSNGSPIRGVLPKLPAAATKPTEAAASDYVTGIVYRNFGDTVVTIRNMNGQVFSVSTAASVNESFDNMTKSVDLLISPKKFDTVTMTVADSSFAAGMLVNASLVANRDHDMDDLTDVRVMARAVNGGVEFTLCTTGIMVGTYKVLYNKG